MKDKKESNKYKIKNVNIKSNKAKQIFKKVLDNSDDFDIIGDINLLREFVKDMK